jgi:hypothetical protein
MTISFSPGERDRVRGNRAFYLCTRRTSPGTVAIRALPKTSTNRTDDAADEPCFEIP